MEEYCLLELQFNLLHVFATLIIYMDIDEDRVPADPGLTVKTSRELNHLGAIVPSWE